MPDAQERTPGPVHDSGVACNCRAPSPPHRPWCEAIREPLPKGTHGYWCDKPAGGTCARNCNP
jgi:hypothetical protein